MGSLFLAIIIFFAQADGAEIVDGVTDFSSQQFMGADDSDSDGASDIFDAGSDKLPTMLTVVRGQRKMTPVSSTILTGKDIVERGAGTVAQALDGVTGLQVLDGPKTGAQLYVRGFDDHNTLLLFDGIPISEIFAGGYDGNNILLEGVSAIEVEKGVTSLLYGPGSSGGIIHIYSDPWHGPAGGKVEVQLRDLTTGELPGYAVRAIGGLTWHHLSAALAFQSQKSTAFPLSRRFVSNPQNESFQQESCNLVEGGCLRKGSAGERQLVQGRLAYNRGRLRLSLLANYCWVDRQVPPYAQGGVVRYWHYKDYNTGLVGLAASLKPRKGRGAGNFSFDSNIYMMFHQDLVEDFQDDTYSQLTTRSDSWFQKSGYHNWSVGLSFAPAVVLWKNNTLRTSYGMKFDNSRQQEWTVPNQQEAGRQLPEAQYAAFSFYGALEDQQKIGPVTLLAGFAGSGLKLPQQNIPAGDAGVDGRLLGGYEWRLALQYDLAKAVQFVAGGGRKLRYPTMKELYAGHVGGNAGLKPERALLIDGGFNFLFAKILSWDFTYKIRGFVSWVTDLIDRPQTEYVNIGRALLAGVENSVQLKPVSWFLFDCGYTFLYARDRDTGLPLDYRTPHSLTAMAKFMLPFGMDIALDLRFASRTDTYYYKKAINEYVLESMDPYALVGLNIRQTWDGLNDRGSFYIFADMRNTFDTVYTMGGFAPQPGRQIFVGLGATF